MFPEICYKIQFTHNFTFNLVFESAPLIWQCHNKQFNNLKFQTIELFEEKYLLKSDDSLQILCCTNISKTWIKSKNYR